MFGKEKVDEGLGEWRGVKECALDVGLLAETEIAAVLQHGQMDP